MKALRPMDIPKPFARYSHGIELSSEGRIVRVSGQLGITTTNVVPSDAFQQAQICFGNIKAVLSEANMVPQNVFHLTGYVTDRKHMAGYMRARDDFLRAASEDSLPTSTLLVVFGFTRPEFLVEVEAWAHAPLDNRD
ncbi:MAG: RidA family protein [Aestuariivita sp.]|nr:RidA family protein [Aestuariivita sp.]MCY4203275.1 RidA family protein [Aestuariivita sp.]